MYRLRKKCVQRDVLKKVYNVENVYNVKICLRVCVLRKCAHRKDVFENVCNAKNAYNMKN